MKVHYLDPTGPLLASESDALDLVGDAYGMDASVVVVPLARLHPDFFDLSTRVAGEFLQKLVNYRIRLVIEGDISPFTDICESLRAFVAESNRGPHIWFVPDRLSLHDRIATIQ